MGTGTGGTYYIMHAGWICAYYTMDAGERDKQDGCCLDKCLLQDGFMIRGGRLTRSMTFGTHGIMNGRGVSQEENAEG
jgi:hypothetical protein